MKMKDFCLAGETSKGDYEILGHCRKRTLKEAEKDLKGRFDYLARPRRLREVVIIEIRKAVKWF